MADQSVNTGNFLRFSFLCIPNQCFSIFRLKQHSNKSNTLHKSIHVRCILM